MPAVILFAGMALLRKRWICRRFRNPNIRAVEVSGLSNRGLLELSDIAYPNLPPMSSSTPLRPLPLPGSISQIEEHSEEELLEEPLYANVDIPAPSGNVQPPPHPHGKQALPNGNEQALPNGNEQALPNENEQALPNENEQAPPNGDEQAPPNGDEQAPHHGNQAPLIPPPFYETDVELLSAAAGLGGMRGTISMSAPNLTIVESPYLKAKTKQVVFKKQVDY